jgi:photosystem II stability/assembly factor-like uncharacterized protein
MKKIVILLLGLSLTALSCNLAGSGTKGILKSDDSGRNFQPMNVLAPKGAISGISSNALVLDPKNPDTLYLGSSNGIYKSTDGAATWNQILTGIAITDLALDQGQSDLVYASGVAGKNGKIIKTSDGGRTWMDIYTEPSKTTTVNTIAVSRMNSRILLAGLGSGELIRSTDSGMTWQAVKELNDIVIKARFHEATEAYALTLTKGLNKSTDLGSNWEPVAVGGVAREGQRTQTNIRKFSGMDFDPKLKGVMFLSTEQGLLRTIDGGVSWSLVYLPVKDVTLRVSAVAIHPQNSNTIYLSIGSTVLKSVNGGITWETIKLPTSQFVRHIVINPVTPNIMYLGMGEGR